MIPNASTATADKMQLDSLMQKLAQLSPGSAEYTALLNQIASIVGPANASQFIADYTAGKAGNEGSALNFGELVSSAIPKDALIGDKDLSKVNDLNTPAKNPLTNFQAQDGAGLGLTAASSLLTALEMKQQPDYASTAYQRNGPKLAGGLQMGAAAAKAGAQAMKMTGNPLIAAGAAAVGAFKSRMDSKVARSEFLEQRAKTLNSRETTSNALAQQNAEQIANVYDTSGNTAVGAYARYGGAVSKLLQYATGGATPVKKQAYETEGGEVMMASPFNKPVAIKGGKYEKIAENLYRVDGPKHKGGGVATVGADKPYVDMLGQKQDSPYVFSADKKMKFDASSILKMIR